MSKRTIPKDHRGLYLCDPFRHGIQAKFIILDKEDKAEEIFETPEELL